MLRIFYSILLPNIGFQSYGLKIPYNQTQMDFGMGMKFPLPKEHKFNSKDFESLEYNPWCCQIPPMERGEKEIEGWSLALPPVPLLLFPFFPSLIQGNPKVTMQQS